MFFLFMNPDILWKKFYISTNTAYTDIWADSRFCLESKLWQEPSIRIGLRGIENILLESLMTFCFYL